MANDVALLVPIHVDALLVNARVASGVAFEIFSNTWSALNSFENPVPPPWGSTNAVEQGVHLHWQLPSALTHGKAPKDSTSAVFPHTPNRWIVVRLSALAQGKAPQKMTAWIVESDFLDANLGSTPYLDPSSTATDLKPTFLGRNLPVAQWSGEISTSGQLFLTATGIAQTSFLAYQPGLRDVYSFYDDGAASLPEGSVLTYLVAGWYSNPSYDPLVVEPAFDPATGIFTDLRWQVLGLGAHPVPTRSVFHGLVNDLIWQTSSVPPRVDSDATSMQVALAYTSVDALSAILALAHSSSSPGPEQIEMMLSAFQYDCLSLLDEPDATAQIELRIRQAWFGSTPGGTIWHIVPVAQGQTTAALLSPVVQTPAPPLTQGQAVWLAALNTRQRAFDVAQRELKTRQWELFALWWKTQYAGANLLQAPGLAPWGIDANKLRTALANQLDSSQRSSFLSQVAAEQTALAQMQGALPIPTSQDSIQKFSKQIPGNTGDLTLKPTALPPFYRPADPVLLIAGITPPDTAPDNGKPLPCRPPSAAVSGVNVQVGGSSVPVTASTGSLASIIQQAGTIPAKTGQPLSTLLDSSVAQALAALSTETFFADPNNATSISVNGLGNSDSTVIAALSTAITNGAAQISTIPNPLQAAFAFALWRQAWTPLFLEWDLQFYPTVLPTFTGQSLPPQQFSTLPLAKSPPVQDNLPMDLGHWSFNGAPDVFARGSEYYTWNGGDIWRQPSTTWLTPQTFAGRSVLTPNAGTLFLARLTEFISKQPKASAAAQVTNGVVTAVTLDSPVAGYSEPPAISFSGGAGTGAAATATVSDGRLVSITVTKGGSGYATPPQVTVGPSDWASIQALIDTIGETRFLSQTLSGFNQNFLMRLGMHTVPPDPSIAPIVAGEDREVPNPGLGDVPIKFGEGQPFFFPARGGFFSLNQLQIVDGFGQVLDLLQANNNSGGGASTFKPILGAGLAPDPAMASAYQVKQAPRIVQPSRINLRWLSNSDDSQEVFLAPNVNPVCGWLIPNHLDHSIAVYDVTGIPIGELLVLMQRSGAEAVTWLPAPNSPGAVTNPADIQNLHLRNVITAFTDVAGGIPAAQRVVAFRAWFNSIDETLWTVDPPGGQSDANLAVLIGRPLVVARLQLSCELYGAPAYNQSWRDTFDLAKPSDQTSLEVGRQEAGFTSLSFPIQLGSTELLGDGLIGYFAADSYTAFNAVHAAASPVSPYIQPIGRSNTLALPFNYPRYTVDNLTVLLDPLGTLHATTGTLPVAEVSLPSQFYASVLAKMAVFFRIGPVLTDPAAIRIPIPAEQRGEWSWVWQTAPGKYEADGVVAATAQARLADSPPHLMEGWLVLTPPDEKNS